MVGFVQDDFNYCHCASFDFARDSTCFGGCVTSDHLCHQKFPPGTLFIAKTAQLAGVQPLPRHNFLPDIDYDLPLCFVFAII
jgi:hypothetical protein